MAQYQRQSKKVYNIYCRYQFGKTFFLCVWRLRRSKLEYFSSKFCFSDKTSSFKFQVSLPLHAWRTNLVKNTLAYSVTKRKIFITLTPGRPTVSVWSSNLSTESIQQVRVHLNTRPGKVGQFAVDLYWIWLLTYLDLDIMLNVLIKISNCSIFETEYKILYFKGNEPVSFC